jgi:hypothetical protein
MQLTEAARKKFSRYRELTEEFGEEQAWEKMLEGFPELQKQLMGPLLSLPTLIEGFRKAIPLFNAIGMEMDAVDISNRGIDSVLEIQKFCPYLEVCREYGFETPCHVICEMDIEASHRAFPEMKGEILCRQAFGSPVCIFKYERPAGEQDKMQSLKTQPGREELMARYLPVVLALVERWAAGRPVNEHSGKAVGYYRLTGWLLDYVVQHRMLPEGVHVMPEGQDRSNRVEPSFPVDFDELTGGFSLPD